MNGYINAVIGGIVAVCLIAATVVLGWHGTLNGEAVVSLLSGVAFGGGAGALAVVAHNAGAKSSK